MNSGLTQDYLVNATFPEPIVSSTSATEWQGPTHILEELLGHNAGPGID